MKSEKEISEKIIELNQEIQDCLKSLEDRPWLKHYDDEEHQHLSEDITVLGEQIEMLNWVLDEK